MKRSGMRNLLLSTLTRGEYLLSLFHFLLHHLLHAHTGIILNIISFGAFTEIDFFNAYYFHTGSALPAIFCKIYLRHQGIFLCQAQPEHIVKIRLLRFG